MFDELARPGLKILREGVDAYPVPPGKVKAFSVREDLAIICPYRSTYLENGRFSEDTIEVRD